jgi:aspartyl aminopeptidase
VARNSDADALIAFLNASPTPFHAVGAAASRLAAAGASQLDEKQSWSLAPGRAYFLERNRSSLVALRLPPDTAPAARLRLRIVAAHTDSPCLKLKPRPPEDSANYRQWGVEVYGGVLYNSWLDRDLGLAGRVSVLGENGVRSALVRLEDRPFRIPQLAIHLDRGVNDSGLILNAQRHLQPVLGLSDAETRGLEGFLEEAAGAPFGAFAFELHLYDTTPAGYGGFADEFVFSGRLDNLGMSHAALSAFCAAAPEPETIQVIALFDNEEVGSVSAQGANSNLIASALERTLAALGRPREELLATLARSHIVSADMAHAIHPNYPEKHEPNHFPLINHGPVIKGNASMRYATNAETSALFRGLCRRAGVPVQDFVNRTDLACGTTIGPHISAALGIPTVDVGNPMLSMHSAREMAGSEDHGMMIRALREFFRG